jgi:beta-galactosidase beta subunit
MLSSVLRSKRAIVVNIQIMRTFVRLRQILAIHKELADELKELENKFNGKWGKHEIEIRGIFKIIRKMMQPPKKKTRRIGFLQD